jgi:hypothetical protein
MRLSFWLIALIVGALFLSMLTVDFRLTIGERAQGGYADRTAEEQADAEARAAASRAEAIDAANEAMKALEAGKAASRDTAADRKE